MSDKKKDKGFEAKLKELENIVEELEDGNLCLDDSVKLYKRGVILTDECQEVLTQAKCEIKKISNGGSESL